MPLQVLTQSVRGLRLGALERAGIRSVGQAADASPRDLSKIDGVGPTTAQGVVKAARVIREHAQENAKVRFSSAHRNATTTDLLRLLWEFDQSQVLVSQAQGSITRFRRSLIEVSDRAQSDRRTARRSILRRRSALQAYRQSMRELADLLEDPELKALSASILQSNRFLRSRPSDDDLWRQFEQNAARYLSLLDSLMGGASASAIQGTSASAFPPSILRAIEAITLNRTHLKAHLRGYQDFGTKYALVQRRVIIGDEMGLGKTVQAIAAICHLAATGARSALVVCPASVVSNWRNEVLNHSSLGVHVIHGPSRDEALRGWRRQGGVAVTTFDGLAHVPLSATGTNERLDSG
jgi:SNF2 family DNA or RNA helicase